MTRFSFTRHVAGALLLLYPATHAEAVMVDIVATSNGFIQGADGVFESLNTTDEEVRSSKSGGNEYRGVFEFDLSSIPRGSVVFGATFLGTTGAKSGSGETEFMLLGFPDDGVIQLSDATAPATFAGRQTPNSLDQPSFFAGLTPAAIQSVINDPVTDFLALRIQAVNNGRWDIFSLEAPATAVMHPTLRVSFLAPEPGTTWTALSATVLAVLWWRRRRQA